MDLKWFWFRLLPRKAFVWRGWPSQRVTLTFDDGPHKDTTDELLRILRGNKVRATFFLSGYQIAMYPDLLTKIYLDGHEVGNHSYNHRPLNELGFEEIVRELTLTQEIVKQHVGYQPKLFRPPYGAVNFRVIAAALKCNLTTVLWTVDPKDFSLDKPAEVIDKLKVPQMRGGEIILLHSYSHATLKALPDIIKALRRRGLQTTGVL
jgi:peptidoglycan/xylan/chitin deacetylase (PgdA/CDA1 family)